MEMTVSIIKQLIELRHSRNLTLKGVAAGTGLSVSFLSDIEHGRGNPTLETLEQIAEFYGHALRIVGPTLTAAPTPPPADTGAGDAKPRACIFCGCTDFVHRWSSERSDYLVCADCNTISHAPFPYHTYGGSK
jgi:transcriptional regulator with XRE-family HTH domain